MRTPANFLKIYDTSKILFMVSEYAKVTINFLIY